MWVCTVSFLHPMKDNRCLSVLYPRLSKCLSKPPVTFQTAVAPRSQGQRHRELMAVVPHHIKCSRWPGTCPTHTFKPAPSKTHLELAPFSTKNLGTKDSQQLPTICGVSNYCSLHRNLLHLLKGSLLGSTDSVFFWCKFHFWFFFFF